nr:DUF1365 domain-containing protein [Saccharopolyspora sp. HNM0983]
MYETTVGHARHDRIGGAFRHRLHTWLVDLDEPHPLPRWLRPFARFDARDHIGSPRRSIRDNIDDRLAAEGIDLRGGRIVMLAHARVLGYVFNPISVFWCYHPDGQPACVLAEVHNTYGGRHCYVLRPDRAGRARADKRFPVSPFLPNSGHYAMTLDEPGTTLRVRVQLRDDAGTPLLTAALTGTRRPATRREFLRLLLRQPLVPQRVAALIRKHGIGLKLRGAPSSRNQENHA